MKHIFSEKQSLHKILALAAAAVLSLAAVGVNPQMYISAEIETPETLPSAETDPPQEENPVKEIDLGEKIFYRWELVDGDGLERVLSDNKEHRVLILATKASGENDNDDFIAYHNFLNGIAPGCFVMGPSANSHGVLWESNRQTEDWIDDNIKNTDNDENRQIYVRSAYAVKDNAKQIDTNKNVFFTATDYYAPFIQLNGLDTKNENANGKSSRKCDIRMQSNDGHTYYLDTYNDGYLDITVDEKPSVQWTFQYHGHDDWTVFVERGGGDDDECLDCQASYGLFLIENDDHEGARFRIYVGEEYYFRQLNEDTKVAPKTITPVTSGEFIAEGVKKHAEGTIIPQGKKLTVEKGGILSVEGNLINNGTIENYGTILVKKGGTIAPFIPSGNVNKDGCGTFRNLGGDVIIQEGGAVYQGLGDEAGRITPFTLSAGSTLINQGLLVFGALQVGPGARLEMYPDSKTFSGWFINKFTLSSSTGATLIRNRGAFIKSLTNLGNGSVFMPQSDEPTANADGNTAASRNDWNSYRMWFINHSSTLAHMSDMLHKENGLWLTQDWGNVIAETSTLVPIRGNTDGKYYQGPLRVDNGFYYDGAKKCVEYVMKMAASKTPDYSQAVIRDVSWYTYGLDCVPAGIYLDSAYAESVYNTSPPIIKMGNHAYFMDEFIVNTHADWVELTI